MVWIDSVRSIAHHTAKTAARIAAKSGVVVVSETP